MERDTPINISLTGTNSHTITIPAGQGSFAIGLVGMDKKKFDALVEKESTINWDAFNGLYTPHGKQHAVKYPFGDWPRFFHYYGDDTGFIEWSAKRPVEDFFWHPEQAATIDLTHAQIRNLFVQAGGSPLHIIPGPYKQDDRHGLQSLTLAGKLEGVTIAATDADLHIHLNPDTHQRGTAGMYRLPVFPHLKNITSLDITVKPQGQAFDCESLLQFPGLKKLSLSGNICNVSSLNLLKEIERLAIRYAPNLEGFSPLSGWEKLQSFIGWNIEEKTGKRLSTELKQLAKEKELDYSSVSKLRSPAWFSTEYGIPFTNWETKNAKAATKAYKTAVKEISKAKTEEDVKKMIIGLIDIINQLPNIETEEREDTGVAVQQLIAASPIPISTEKGNEWFDENRDF